MNLYQNLWGSGMVEPITILKELFITIPVKIDVKQKNWYVVTVNNDDLEYVTIEMDLTSFNLIREALLHQFVRMIRLQSLR